MAWDYGDRCVICGNPYVHRHHVFPGTANRRKSDQYGYVIPLCARHHTGDYGIHRCRPMMEYWMKEAQADFEQTHTREEFIKEFGRSYL